MRMHPVKTSLPMLWEFMDIKQVEGKDEARSATWDTLYISVFHLLISSFK